MPKTLGSKPSTTKRMSKVSNLRVKQDTANLLTQERGCLGIMANSSVECEVKVVRSGYINADRAWGKG